MAVVGAVLVTGCSEDSGRGGSAGPGSSSQASGSPSAQGSEPDAAPTVELDKPYPAPDDVARTLPEAQQQPLTSKEGHRFTLAGVHRLGEDRVVVTGVLALDPAVGQDFAINGFEEPALRRASSRGSEFAPFELRVAEDPATYLPVRDEEERCLCSVVRSGFQEVGDAMAVMTVVSAPAGASTVDLTVIGFGSLPGVAVTPVPEQTTTPWGAKETLAVRSVRREDGTVTARVTLASPQETTGFGRGVYGFTGEQLCLSGIAVAGTSRTAGHPKGCVRGILPGAGQAVDVEVTLPDPGTDALVVLPQNGFPMSVPVDGGAAEGGGAELVAYESRSRTEGATVATGETVEVVLDTSVLFAVDQATLTPAAQRTIAVAVETLRGQPGRALSVTGHTDTVGGAASNLRLSQRRAEAVRAALASALGAEWSFEVSGLGESRPLAKEAGSPEDVERARARNRRVEVTVTE